MRVMTSLVCVLITATAIGACSDDSSKAPAGTASSTSSTSSTGGTGGAGGSDGAIHTEHGPVVGADAGMTTVYFGIPYAKAPVGELRFAPPEPPEPWSEPIANTGAGSDCAQRDLVGGKAVDGTEEDCLTLNVWVPKGGAAVKPVMVWIHGGAFEIGSGHQGGQYSGENLAPFGDVIVVTINYRLGPLGFLSHPDLPGGGNFGFEDQQLALRWVKSNIAAFGGDPGEVTIFGESAGGMSVCLHLVAPDSAGLFHRAIIESGPCIGRARSQADSEKQGQDLAAALGCDKATDAVACLRGKSWQEVATALPPSSGVFFGGGARWGPVAGGVLPEPAADVIAAGKHQAVPAIVGSNKDEGTLFVALAGLTGIDETQYASIVTAAAPALGTDEATLLAEYPASAYASAGAALSALLGEAVFNCPTRRLARALSGHADTYLYHFVYEPDFTALGQLGAFHAAEVAYVFGTSIFGLKKITEAERDLSDAIMGHWTRLASSGDPNGAGSAWPKYTVATDEHLEIDLATTESGTGLRQDKCDFWDAL